jgi:hypothetical protein
MKPAFYPLIAVVCFFSLSSNSQAQTAQVRIVDIGGGLCSVSEVPEPNGPVYMVYDAG